MVAAREHGDLRGRGAGTVLLVEDYDALRRVLCYVLQADGHTVFTAGNATEALEIIEELGGMVDVVVTDVVLPGMSGLELGEFLARHNPAVRLLLMTGLAEAVQGEELHQVALQKPFEHGDLLRAVRALVRRGRAAA